MCSSLRFDGVFTLGIGSVPFQRGRHRRSHRRRKRGSNIIARLRRDPLRFTACLSRLLDDEFQLPNFRTAFHASPMVEFAFEPEGLFAVAVHRNYVSCVNLAKEIRVTGRAFAA